MQRKLIINFISPKSWFLFLLLGYKIYKPLEITKCTIDLRSTVTSNQILKRVAMENNMHYWKQNTMDSMTSWHVSCVHYLGNVYFCSAIKAGIFLVISIFWSAY